MTNLIIGCIAYLTSAVLTLTAILYVWHGNWRVAFYCILFSFLVDAFGDTRVKKYDKQNAKDWQDVSEQWRNLYEDVYDSNQELIIIGGNMGLTNLNLADALEASRNEVSYLQARREYWQGEYYKLEDKNEQLAAACSRKQELLNRAIGLLLEAKAQLSRNSTDNFHRKGAQE